MHVTRCPVPGTINLTADISSLPRSTLNCVLICTICIPYTGDIVYSNCQYHHTSLTSNFSPSQPIPRLALDNRKTTLATTKQCTNIINKMNRGSDLPNGRIITPTLPITSPEEYSIRYCSSPLPPLTHSPACSEHCQSRDHYQQGSIIDEALLAAIPPSNNNDKPFTSNVNRHYPSDTDQHLPVGLARDAHGRTHPCERLPSIRGLLQSVYRVKSVPTLVQEHGELVRRAHPPYYAHPSMMMNSVDPRRLAETGEALPSSPTFPPPIPLISPLHATNLGYQHLQALSHSHTPNPSQRQNEASPQNLQKIHKCLVEGCQKIFPTKSRLNRHAIVHSGDKPFKCLFSKCNKAFSRKDNMLQHFKSHGIMGTANSKREEDKNLLELLKEVKGKVSERE